MNEEVKTEVFKEALSWAKTVVLAVVLALCINNVVIVNAKIPSGSMMDIIMPDDRIVAFRLSYVLSPPERYDIVVFRYPDERSTLFVKRVIGLPGETVRIADGRVYIDGGAAPLDDYYVPEKPLGDFGPYEVPEGFYFMLGDNRNNSKDSRYWINTYVDSGDILGKVVFRYYPNLEILYGK